MGCASIPEAAEVSIHVTIKQGGVVRLQDESFVPGACQIVYKTLDGLGVILLGVS